MRCPGCGKMLNFRFAVYCSRECKEKDLSELREKIRLIKNKKKVIKNAN